MVVPSRPAQGVGMDVRATLKVQALKSEDHDPDPDAIACYGFYQYDTRKVSVRFVEGRPVGDITVQFLEWLRAGLADEGKKVLVVIWDGPCGSPRRR
jgi:hypothetical protein